MTDRIKGFWVALDQNMREDDAEPIISAVKQIRHVIAVSPRVSEMATDSWIAEERVRREWGEKLLAIVFPDWGKDVRR